MAPSGKPTGILPNPYAKVLPNPYAAATVAEAAPVKSSEEQAKAETKKIPVFHNPHGIKRPQAKGPTVKKPQIARSQMIASSPASSDPAPAAAAAAAPTTKQTLELPTPEQDNAILDYKREQERMERERKKQKKKLHKQFGWWNQDALYKADTPSNLRAYRAEGGFGTKIGGFAGFLKFQAPPARIPKASIELPVDLPSTSSVTPEPAATVEKPSKPSFAPPASYDDDRTSTSVAKAPVSSPPQPPAPYAHVPPPPPPPPPVEAPASTPPPPPPAPAPYNPTISAPPVRYNPTISAPPVRYDIPVNRDEPKQQERPAKRPKLSVGEAMMARMGFKKGQGLGKNNDGITTHLEVKARKKEKDYRGFDPSDDYNESGKTIKGQQVFDILGGHTTKRSEPSMFGVESKVIVAWGCVDGINWDADAERDDGGIRQEMGQTFDDKFGRIERVYVHMSGEGQPVYIKFASELSALNAVNRFHEGYQFRGRDIRARYYEEAKFEASVFDH